MTSFRPSDHIINLQGKDYLPVAPRVLWARGEHPAWSIVTEPVTIGDAMYMRATVIDDANRVLATAHKAVRAHGRGPVGQFPVEAAETGAIGRALGLCGYGTLAGDLGDDVADSAEAELADAPVPAQPARKPSAPRAPARSAPAPVDLVAIVDSLKRGTPLPDVMRAIQKSGAPTGEIHAAWCDAIGMAADLCRDGDDLAAVNATYDKIKGRLTDQQRGACGAAIDAARVDINERALHVPGDA